MILILILNVFEENCGRISVAFLSNWYHVDLTLSEFVLFSDVSAKTSSVCAWKYPGTFYQNMDMAREFIPIEKDKN